MKKKHLAGVALVIALALPATAGAHVTLQPSSAAAGSYTVESVRVPNEKDNASTTKVTVRFPGGFAGASYEPVAGWTAKVKTTKLAEPIKTDDGEITEQVSQITWTADSAADGIAPRQFRDFPLSVKIPGKEGDTLTFKALQTYSDGEVVRWIGAPDSDNPAPVVAVTAAQEGHRGAAAEQDKASTDESDGASQGLGLAALIIGALGLTAGATAIVLTRGK